MKVRILAAYRNRLDQPSQVQSEKHHKQLCIPNDSGALSDSRSEFDSLRQVVLTPGAGPSILRPAWSEIAGAGLSMGSNFPRYTPLRRNVDLLFELSIDSRHRQSVVEHSDTHPILFCCLGRL